MGKKPVHPREKLCSLFSQVRPATVSYKCGEGLP
jgi:hypothetical protein